MRNEKTRLIFYGMICFLVLAAAGCKSKTENITSLEQLKGKVFAVPSGTVADKLVLSKFPNAQFHYFNSVLDAALAVQTGKADVAAYDEPILRNLAAKYEGLAVLPDMITIDKYAVAVGKDNTELKAAIDEELKDLKDKGGYDDMMARWFPKVGAPAPMPDIPLDSSAPLLRLGTAAVTEPFSFMDASQQVVGFDIELAKRVAQRLGKNLEVVNMDFGGMIPALMAGKVDMIAACITVTPERAQKVLFSEPYYTGGIAALVRAPKQD
ncbi:MAG: transporter substrate-binding domain-containing protein [Thermodesulfobacteriota bacterium]